MPYIPSAGELKTKPTQHSVKELRSIGIAPDILLVRCDRPIPVSEKKKLSLFCNVRQSAVIQALDVSSIYDVPIAYHEEGLDREVLAAFGITDAREPELSAWRDVSQRLHNPEGEVTIEYDRGRRRLRGRRRPAGFGRRAGQGQGGGGQLLEGQVGRHVWGGLCVCVWAGERGRRGA